MGKRCKGSCLPDLPNYDCLPAARPVIKHGKGTEPAPKDPFLKYIIKESPMETIFKIPNDMFKGLDFKPNPDIWETWEAEGSTYEDFTIIRAKKKWTYDDGHGNVVPECFAGGVSFTMLMP